METKNTSTEIINEVNSEVKNETKKENTKKLTDSIKKDFKTVTLNNKKISYTYWNTSTLINFNKELEGINDNKIYEILIKPYIKEEVFLSTQEQKYIISLISRFSLDNNKEIQKEFECKNSKCKNVYTEILNLSDIKVKFRDFNFENLKDIEISNDKITFDAIKDIDKMLELNDLDDENGLLEYMINCLFSKNEKEFESYEDKKDYIYNLKINDYKNISNLFVDNIDLTRFSLSCNCPKCGKKNTLENNNLIVDFLPIY